MAEFKLDAKYRKALLGLMPFSQEGTLDYTPEGFDELPEEIRPVFKLRALKRGEIQTVKDITFDDKIKIKIEKLIKAIRPAILGWDKVYDLATGNLIPFEASEDGGPTKELWERMPDTITTLLYREISVMSGLQKAEKQGLKS
jgi:hypothetical protein